MFGKKKFKPDLIDLQEYEYQLLVSKDRGGTLRPVTSIPGLIIQRDWTCEEEQAMKKNRRLAQEIYDNVSESLRN